jgi:DNA-binding response OmpR family regulator
MIDKYKILVVDDELPVCKSIAAALESDNYVIDTAYSGEEALQKNEETNYDVVIADLMMLGISGLVLLKILKEK